MKKIFLVGIVFIACLFRFYQLGTNPPSLTWDEAAWGYNAYALGIDGRDEFGRFLPYDYLESFGDYKPPVYAYLDILPVKLFGLHAFATRFPSAFFGVLTVLITYFLVKKIFYTSRYKEAYALFSSLFLAISPWHILLSRAAFEANVATFFIVCGVWLFLCGIQEKKWCLVLSFISFVLSVYTFNSARIVAPLLMLVLSFIFRKELFERKKAFFVAVIIACLLILPITEFLVSSQASLRFKEVNIFSDQSVIETANQEIANDHNASWSKVLHNRRVLFGLSYMMHYFDNLSPLFLFIKGDGNPKFSTQDVGQMYIWDIVFFVLGILILFKKKEGYYFVIPLWLLLGIIPAATARETPHALRTEVTLPTFQIFTAYGFVFVHTILRQNVWLRTLLFFLLFFNVSYFSYTYFIHYPKDYAAEWQYGYEQSIAYVQSVKDRYGGIFMTQALGRPYIYYLFYTKENPNIFRATAKIQRDPFGFVHVNGYGKYLFGSAVRTAAQTKKTLFIDNPQDVPSSARKQKTFYMPDGTKSLVAYTL